MSRTRARSLLLNAALLLGSTALTVFALEAGVRLFTGDRYLDVDFRGRRGDLVYEPNQKLRWKRIEWDITVETNSKGLRDVEHAGPAKNALVALGDSFTEGYGVELDESWGRRLGRELAAAGKPWRVYVSGVQGLQPEQYFTMYERFWKREPGVELVIMGFCVGTDIESGPGSPTMPAPAMSTSYYVKRWLCEHSVLYNFVRRPAKLSPVAQQALMKLGLMRPNYLGLVWADEAHMPAWEFTMGRLEKFRARLKKDGKELVVMLIPNKEAVETEFLARMLELSGTDPARFDATAFSRYALARSKKSGLPLLDLTVPMQEADKMSPGAFYFKSDGHWSPAGHAFAASELARFLKDRKLPPFRR